MQFNRHHFLILITLFSSNSSYAANYNPCNDLSKDPDAKLTKCDKRDFNSLDLKSLSIQGGPAVFFNSLPSQITNENYVYGSVSGIGLRNSQAQTIDKAYKNAYAVRLNAIFEPANIKSKALNISNTTKKPVYSLTAYYSWAKNSDTDKASFPEPTSTGAEVTSKVKSTQDHDFGFLSVERQNNPEEPLFPGLFDLNTNVGMMVTTIKQVAHTKINNPSNGKITYSSTVKSDNNFTGAGFTAGLNTGIRLNNNNTVVDFTSKVGLLLGGSDQSTNGNTTNMVITNYSRKKLAIVPVLDASINVTQKLTQNLHLKVTGYGFVAAMPEMSEVIARNNALADASSAVYKMHSDQLFKHASVMAGFEYWFNP